jgi:predicted nucleic acid-binding protein
MNSVFADTAFFVAFLSRRDRFHELAHELMNTLQARIVTTDWVLVEVANFMATTRLRVRVASLVRDLQADPRSDIVPASAAAIEAGLAFYELHDDKEWSLTDCISFQVMRREAIAQALTADHHFEQAGFEILLKPNA